MEKENEKIIGGFVVIYVDSDVEDYARFCDSLEEANKFCDEIIKEGYITAKIFKEVV